MTTSGNVQLDFGGKESEISNLRALRAHAPDDSYLAMLLTPQFLEWAAEQIKADYPPDIMEHLEAAHRGRAEDHKLAVEASRESAKLLEVNREMVEALRADLTAREVEVMHLKAEADLLKARVEEAGQRVVDMVERHAHEACKRHKAVRQKKAARKENSKLKVRLYDLLHGGKAKGS